MASTTDNMKHQMSEPGLRVSKLPVDVRAEVGRLNLDKDEDGKINSAELLDLIVECKSLLLPTHSYPQRQYLSVTHE